MLYLATLFKVVPSVTIPVPSVHVLPGADPSELSLTACLFCGLFPPLACEFLDGRDFVFLVVASAKPNARPGPHSELQVFVE